MQSLAILLNAIACPDHFPEHLESSTHSAKQLIKYLQIMRETNAVAARAYQVLNSIVKTSKPFVWNDIMDAFPNDLYPDVMDLVMQHYKPMDVRADAKYLPWPGRDLPSETLFRYEFDGFGNCSFHAL
jgi:hypothetical protein